MTRTEFIHQALLRAWAMHAKADSKFDPTHLIEFADALEKSGVAPWDATRDERRLIYEEGVADGSATAVVAEREACAKIADNVERVATERGFADKAVAARHIASVIRTSRGST